MSTVVTSVFPLNQNSGDATAYKYRYKPQRATIFYSRKSMLCCTSRLFTECESKFNTVNTDRSTRDFVPDLSRENNPKGPGWQTLTNSCRSENMEALAAVVRCSGVIFGQKWY